MSKTTSAIVPLATNPSLLELIKDIDSGLYREKEFLINGAAHRDIFDKVNYINFNVIDNPYVPPGSYYVVDKKDMWIGRYDTKYEVETKHLEREFKNQYLQQWAPKLMKEFEDNVLMKALGVDRQTFTATVPENACDACRGTGVFNGEECWHCLGDGDDPTK